jgi:Peptidase M50B-like
MGLRRANRPARNRRLSLRSVSLTQAVLPGTTATVIGLAAFGLVVVPLTWLVVRHVAVAAHRGAHALTGLVVYRSVRDGLDVESAAGLRSVPVALAGYLGPSGFGLGAAKVIELGYSPVVLWLGLALLAVLLIGLLRSFGLILAVLAGGIVFGVGRYAPVHVQAVLAYSVAWLLLLSGIRRVIEIGVSGITGLPRLLWFPLWLTATLAAAFEGARLLIMKA